MTKEELTSVFVLRNKNTGRLYRRRGTISASVWSTSQGASNARAAAPKRYGNGGRDDWEVEELQIYPPELLALASTVPEGTVLG